MTLFFRRFVGALALSPGAFEDIEADRRSAMQSVVVIAACLAGGVGAVGFGAVGVSGFVTGALMVLGAWLVWVGVIAVVGTTTLAEPQTRSDAPQLLRVIGVRQALDYQRTSRAVAVCALACVLSFGTMAAVALILSRPVG